jgi:CheY-like chemotaxis protein
MIIKRVVQILLVEDNAGDAFLAIEAFKSGKIESIISVAKDGEEALDYLYKRGKFTNVETPDLILLDINLPKIDGMEVLSIIKKDEKLRLVPVLMLTTSTSENDIIDAYYHHANSYISKPVDVDHFFDAVNKIENFWLSVVELPPNN